MKAVFIFLSITFFASTCGIETYREKIYKKCIENIKIYKMGVNMIDGTLKIVSEVIALFVHTTHNKRVALYFENEADQRINNIRKNLINKQKTTIENIAIDFGATKEELQSEIAFFNQFLELSTIYMSQPHSHIVPMQLDSELFFLFEDTNVHPSNIEIIISLEPNNENHNRIATANKLIPKINITNNNISSVDAQKLPSIIIYPKFFSLSDKQKKATLAHEIGHIASQHATIQDNIINAIEYFADVKQEQIMNNKNYKQLIIIHEQQADILHKNPKTAELMRQYRATGYYPKCLFLKHYWQLAQIDELYKFSEKLRNYSSDMHN